MVWLLVIFLLPAAALAVAEGPSPQRERFEQAYRLVLSRVAGGELPVSAEEEAIDLRSALGHQLVDHEQALERLKRQLQRAAPAQREALAGLVAEAGAARERLVHDCLRRMEQLLTTGALAPTGPGEGSLPASLAPAAPSVVLPIESRPEDPTLGRFE
ncbi:hypothetical protein [Desulfuromonas versatilis]|uniref:hypothetical protein n=1 Tax=Desulfuromonas versatilis TaxID=2802975 RepID=UPI001C857966|nr:hypothetical protein [Desulfuromonas versatilis]